MKKLLCSACLLGVPCRYDGKSKPISRLNELKEHYTLIPFCPEVEGGLSTPRLPCEICNGAVIRSDGKDLTKEYTQGAKKALAKAQSENISIALLKEKSPSCGVHFRYDGSFQKKLTEGTGLTASLLKENGINVCSEEELDRLL